MSIEEEEEEEVEVKFKDLFIDFGGSSPDKSIVSAASPLSCFTSLACCFSVSIIFLSLDLSNLRGERLVGDLAESGL